MKKFALLASLLVAGVTMPAFATDTTGAATPPETITSLEDLLAHSRVSVGASREGVLTEMREPSRTLGHDVWIYTGFRASNVYGGEQFDTLVVTFKNDQVSAIRLATAAQIRLAVAQSAAGARKIARR